MLSLTLVGPVLTFLVLIDIVLHMYLDYQKILVRQSDDVQEPYEQAPRYGLIFAESSTILSFIVVFIICVSWVWNISISTLSFFIFFYNPPMLEWQIGSIFLCIGILLHGWSRLTRHEMASSWGMSDTHELVKSGPYRLIRHPSYTSYFLCFVGLFLVIPSLVTALLLLGFPGYYKVATAEERLLIAHFGEEYLLYMKKTGMFLPKIVIVRD